MKKQFEQYRFKSFLPNWNSIAQHMEAQQHVTKQAERELCLKLMESLQKNTLYEIMVLEPTVEVERGMDGVFISQTLLIRPKEEEREEDGY